MRHFNNTNQELVFVVFAFSVNIHHTCSWIKDGRYHIYAHTHCNHYLQLFKKFNDPDTKARYFNELMINTLVLEDSDGKKYNVIKIGERCLPWFLAAPGGRGFQDIDNYSYRDDDIFIVTFPKTGLSWHFFCKYFKSKIYFFTVLQ